MLTASALPFTDLRVWNCAFKEGIRNIRRTVLLSKNSAGVRLLSQATAEAVDV